jgi:hypothetical protein
MSLILNYYLKESMISYWLTIHNIRRIIFYNYQLSLIDIGDRHT